MRWRWAGTARRLLLIALILAQTIGATYLMAAVLPYKGRHPLEIASLTLYAVLFAWISAGFWTAVFGFFVLLFKRDKYSISELGRAHVCTPVTNAHIVCRLMLDK